MKTDLSLFGVNVLLAGCCAYAAFNGSPEAGFFVGGNTYAATMLLMQVATR